MSKIAILLLTIMMPTFAFGGEPQITPLNKYQKAPFSGVLYNAEAIAEMVAWKEILVQQHQLALDQLRDSLNAHCTLQIENLGAELDGCNDRYSEMLGIKNAQIITLEELALDRPNSHTHLWFTGGIVLGILTTVGISYAVSQ